ncbi:transcription factor bHLH120-like [Solanum pennellii]|uniref:Transcription factor bHLH120-like n=1 Tax=Solanum pennellii TaxID=28526 RepID=A0ABM1H8E1_SOLPN|nr:transcription factor bHLH120-like [Solanum pennellii]
MDDSEFDFGQLDQLFNFLSPPPPLPPTTLQSNQDSSFSLQKQNSNIVFTSTHNVPKKKPILITNINIIDDQVVQDLPKEKEMVVEKKVMRRDVERQRRRDMAKLYQRLRLLIPSKYLMGKRSISDHLEEIVDYVKDLKKDIEELESKREKLKEMKNITNISSLLAPNSSSMKLNDDDEDKIIVKSCNEGVEISIKGGLSISKVLKVLMKEGFIVNNCVSSTINQRLIHIIQTKVNTRGDIDLALLRSKLMGLF